MKQLRHLFLCILTLFLGFTSNIVSAQLFSSKPNDSQQAQEEIQQAKDPYGRSTPRGTVKGYLEAMAGEDYEKAIHYFDFSYLPVAEKETQSIKAVQNFQKLLNEKGYFKATSLLSNIKLGDTDDKIDNTMDNVGSYTWQEKTFPILVAYVTPKDASPIWLFSKNTLQTIPFVLDQENPFFLEKLATKILSEHKAGGVAYSHWFLLLILIPITLLITWSLVKGLSWVIKKIVRKIWPNHALDIVDAFSTPVLLFVAAYVFVEAARISGVPIIARQYVSGLPVIVAWLALILFCWKILNALFDVSIQKLHQRNDVGKLSAMLFFKRAALFIFIIMGLITTLKMLGVDVTTGIAALGIGGLAIALGAQKTVENLVGSITVIFDQPVRVGDYCKIGDLTGTIEKIGMRSTRIRTLNRTLLTIPNGYFSSQTIENYAFRDKFRYIHTFGVRYETSPDQIRYLLVEMRSILYAHPLVYNDPARVRFVSLDNYQLSIEVFAYINAQDNNEFLEIQEDLHLRFMDVVSQAGSGFAFPSQTLYINKDTNLPAEQTKAAENKVKQWRDQQELQLPRFSENQIKNLEGKIQYPPSSSSMSKKTPK